VIKFTAGFLSGAAALALGLWAIAARNLYGTQPTKEEEQQ
jgi:hypothetical protein